MHFRVLTHQVLWLCGRELLPKVLPLDSGKGVFQTHGLAVAKAFPTPPPLMIIVLVKKNRLSHNVVISDEVRGVSTAYSESSSADFSIGT